MMAAPGPVHAPILTEHQALEALAHRLLAEGPALRTLPTSKRIRILFNGQYVADTTRALYVWEHSRYPWYYIPVRDFASGVIKPGQFGGEGPIDIVDLVVDGRWTGNILAFYNDSSDDYSDDEAAGGGRTVGGVAAAPSRVGPPAPPRSLLPGLARVPFDAVDAWFEEDERIYVHPRDPFKRVDVLRSARPVRVSVPIPGNNDSVGPGGAPTGGPATAAVEVARADAGALHLYETGLPVRYYLPPTAVDWSMLRESATTSQCPYKGVARYYDVVLRGPGDRETVLKDLVWYYRDTTHESSQIAGALCFYNEKVDIELDGKLLERPKTHFA